jgi:hypothetical protein
MSTPTNNNSLRSAILTGVIIAAAQVLLTTISTYIIFQKQEAVRTEVARLNEGQAEIGRKIASKNIEFYDQAISTLADIDKAFQEICYFTQAKDAESRLTDSLEKYQKLFENPPIELDSKKMAIAEVTKEMKNYSTFVLEKWKLISSLKVRLSDSDKAKFYQESIPLREKTREQLRRVIT